MTEQYRDPGALVGRAKRGDPNFDQHFLVDERVLNRVPTYLPDGADRRHLLEIGGGTGGLTDRLLVAGERVTVVERDRALAAFLREEFSAERTAGRLTVVQGDALEVDLPDFSACVSNLPYGISSEIAFRLLPLRRPLVLMFQGEFADRMAATVGEDAYGRLSVTAGHYADVEIVERVPATAFDPQPRVDSALVRCTPRDPAYAVPEETFFLEFVTACFTQRRKTMRNAVRNTAHISGLSEPEAVVEAADEELMQKRAGNVSPTEFAELAAVAWEVGRP